MESWKFCLLLLIAWPCAKAFIDYDSEYNLKGIFEHCAMKNRSSPSTNCVCMNTIDPRASSSDSRRRITQFRCYDCRKECSDSKCSHSKKLDSCTSDHRGCSRLCLCRCPNRTTIYEGKKNLYIRCVDWCHGYAICPSAYCTGASSYVDDTWRNAGIACGILIMFGIIYHFRSKVSDGLDCLKQTFCGSSSNQQRPSTPVEADRVSQSSQENDRITPPSEPEEPSAPPPHPYPADGEEEERRNLNSDPPSYYEATHMSELNGSPPDYNSIVQSR